jgi:hypothetical protein
MNASAQGALVALTLPAHRRPRHKGQLTWSPNWKINRSKAVTRMQCAFGAAAMTALADYATTRAGDDRLPHTELFLHRHEDRR